MKIIKSVEEFKSLREAISPRTIGFVPTLGGLHEGHLSLIKESIKNNEMSVVSIFLNPTQFNNESDLATYPGSLSDDLKTLDSLDVDIVFTPSNEAIYPNGYNYKICEERTSSILEGEFRPGHYEGVLTVVMKLLNIVNPKNAYFGEKDFQQYILIKNMVEDFFLDINIIALKTIREKSGLAMSSRNNRLSDEARQRASLIYKSLLESPSDEHARATLEEQGFNVEYIKSWMGRRFGAVEIEKVRLIDNVSL